jgi:hypothetical protein
VNTIDNTDDIIDVRNIIERVEELREERDALQTAKDDAEAAAERPAEWSVLQEKAMCFDNPERADDAALYAKAAEDLREWKASNVEELARLESILSDLEGNGGDHQWDGSWYPITLIRDTYFEAAMDELLEDIGDLPKNLPSYLTITVDYDALRMDYTSTEIDGVTYWYR